MPYCVNCGEQYNRPQNYCRRCGLSLSAKAGSFASDNADASTRSVAYERSYLHLRRKQRDAQDSNESLQMYLGCVAALAFIHGMSIFLTGLDKLLTFSSPWLWLLLAGLVLGALFKFVFDIRYGYSPARSIIEIVIAGVLCYALVFGSLYYLHQSMPKPGQPLFNFPTPVPAKTP